MGGRYRVLHRRCDHYFRAFHLQTHWISFVRNLPWQTTVIVTITLAALALVTISSSNCKSTYWLVEKNDYY